MTAPARSILPRVSLAWDPFGHGKNVYFWSFVVSMMLFTLGGAFSIWEGLRKVMSPGVAQPMRWAFAVLAGAFVFESISLFIATRALRQVKGRRSLREYITENRDPTLLTVLFDLSYTGQIWAFRVLVWVVPIVVGWIAYRVCIELQRGELVERERKLAEAEARHASGAA